MHLVLEVTQTPRQVLHIGLQRSLNVELHECSRVTLERDEQIVEAHVRGTDLEGKAAQVGHGEAGEIQQYRIHLDVRGDRGEAIKIEEGVAVRKGTDK